MTYSFDDAGIALPSNGYVNPGMYLPTQALSNFNNLNANGNWILTISDQIGGDGGTINVVSLTITTTASPINWYTVPVNGSSVFTGVSFNAITNGGVNTANPGTYSFYAESRINNSCSSSRTQVTFTVNQNPIASGSVTNPIACNGGNGVIAVSATGGTPSYTGTGTNTVSAGTYTYTVTDANGCSSSTAVTITQPTPLTASSSQGTNISCNSGTTTINVTASGGTPSYTGTGTFTVGVGTYSYTVTDAHGCSATTTAITVTQPAALSFTTVRTNVSGCGSNGTIATTATGGTGIKTFSKDGGTTYQGASLFSNLTAATYPIRVKDANGCLSAVVNNVITANAAVSFTTTVLNATTCSTANGKITVAPSGGSGFFNYSKDGGTTYQASNIFNLLMPGDYNIRVKDALGCLSPIVSVHVGCPGGRMDEENSNIQIKSFNVYPNPTNDYANIVFSSDKQENFTVRLIDITGRDVMHYISMAVIGNNQYQMDLSIIAKGVYMIVLQKGEAVMKTKIVVE